MFLGIAPEKELFARFNIRNLDSFPISPGIWPVKLFLLSQSTLRKLRLPTAGDNEPINLLEFKTILMTWPCLGPQVMPIQLQKWLDSFQEAVMLRGSDIIPFLKEIRAKWSVSFPDSLAQYFDSSKNTRWKIREDIVLELKNRRNKKMQGLYYLKHNKSIKGAIPFSNKLY